MSADERALLLAVAADPDADLPRLVYADFLDDAGDPARAGFIRLQCEWHRAVTDPDRAAFCNHLFNKLQDHGLAHGECLPPDFGGAVAWADCRRGLPTTATVIANELAGPLADVFLAAPLLRLTVEHATGAQLVALAEVPRELTIALVQLGLDHIQQLSAADGALERRYGDVLRFRYL